MKGHETMKRLSLSLAIALLTFITGLVTTWEHFRISSVLPLAGNALNFNFVGHRPSGHLEIRYLRFIEREYGNYAEFQVVNGSTERAYYQGYGKDSHCANRIRHGGTVEQASHCWCGTGLAEQALWPGESANFQVSVPLTSGAFEVGFDFLIGKQRLKDTAWSGKIEIPAR
jgi:hypothetical protein